MFNQNSKIDPVDASWGAFGSIRTFKEGSQRLPNLLEEYVSNLNGDVHMFGKSSLPLEQDHSDNFIVSAHTSIRDNTRDIACRYIDKHRSIKYNEAEFQPS